MPTLHPTTPAADGYRMPAEFEPHAGCWMLWPTRPDVWRNNTAPARHAFAEVATAIARFEPVTVGVNRDDYAEARATLPDAVRVVELSSDDAWMRDCGPTFVVNNAGNMRAVDWVFNAWGGELDGLYADWTQDDLVASKVAEIERADRYRAPIVVEGGAIHVDGEGTLITTSSCLLNPNRNPGRSRTEMTDLLCAYTGAEKVIWLDFEAFEETDGHVDGVCAFVRPGVMVVDWTDDPDTPEYAACRAAWAQLEAATDARGRSFELHKLHAATPPPLTSDEARGIQPMDGSYPRRAGEPIGGTYCNFYIANGGVVVPTYDHPRDAEALATLARLFPDHEIVGVPAREIAIGGGMVHCITQQVPLAKRG
ncbi:MAG: agmatine deiminase [Chloroflexota bacterium]